MNNPKNAIKSLSNDESVFIILFLTYHGMQRLHAIKSNFNKETDLDDETLLFLQKRYPLFFDKKEILGNSLNLLNDSSTESTKLLETQKDKGYLKKHLGGILDDESNDIWNGNYSWGRDDDCDRDDDYDDYDDRDDDDYDYDHHYGHSEYEEDGDDDDDDDEKCCCEDESNKLEYDIKHTEENTNELNLSALNRKYPNLDLDFIKDVKSIKYIKDNDELYYIVDKLINLINNKKEVLADKSYIKNISVKAPGNDKDNFNDRFNRFYRYIINEEDDGKMKNYFPLYFYLYDNKDEKKNKIPFIYNIFSLMQWRTQFTQKIICELEQSIFIDYINKAYKDYCKKEGIDNNTLFDNCNKNKNNVIPFEKITCQMNLVKLHKMLCDMGWISKKTDPENFLYVFGLRKILPESFTPIEWILMRKEPNSHQNNYRALLNLLYRMGYSYKQIVDLSMPSRNRYKKINSCFTLVFTMKNINRERRYNYYEFTIISEYDSEIVDILNKCNIKVQE